MSICFRRLNNCCDIPFQKKLWPSFIFYLGVSVIDFMKGRLPFAIRDWCMSAPSGSVFTGEGEAGIAGIDLGYGGIVLAPQS